MIPDSESVVAVPVRKGEAALLEEINSALDELRENGTLKELSFKYFDDDYTESIFKDTKEE